MSKKNPKNIKQMRQGDIYLDAEGYVVWLTHYGDSRAGTRDLWHVEANGGTWPINSRKEDFPMTRIFKQER